jgi:hypothetical protein
MQKGNQMVEVILDVNCVPYKLLLRAVLLQTSGPELRQSQEQNRMNTGHHYFEYEPSASQTC